MKSAKNVTSRRVILYIYMDGYAVGGGYHVCVCALIAKYM